jgi:hypothetical protein
MHRSTKILLLTIILAPHTHYVLYLTTVRSEKLIVGILWMQRNNYQAEWYKNSHSVKQGAKLCQVIKVYGQILGQ